MISIPAHLLQIAAKFVANDASRGTLNAVCLRHLPDSKKNKPDLSQIEIVATNGHIAFRCRFFIHQKDSLSWGWTPREQVLIVNPKACKVPKTAHTAHINTITQSLNYLDHLGNLLLSMPYVYGVDPGVTSSNTFTNDYPNLDRIFPTPEDFSHLINTPIGFNGAYMALIGNITAKYAYNSVMRMHVRQPTQSALITCDISLDRVYPAEIVIMPIQIRP